MNLEFYFGPMGFIGNFNTLVVEVHWEILVIAMRNNTQCEIYIQHYPRINTFVYSNRSVILFTEQFM